LLDCRMPFCFVHVSNNILAMQVCQT
jgi:hypothetical protein